MAGVLFFLITVASGFGLYFLAPILIMALPLVTLLMCSIYLGRLDVMNTYSKKSKERDGRFVRTTVCDEFILETTQLSAREHNEVIRVAKDRAPALCDRMPSDAILKIVASKLNNIWKLQANIVSSKVNLNGASSGFSALESFLLLEPILKKQIQDWIACRTLELYDGPKLEIESPNSRIEFSDVNVLIVDDDIDAAMLVMEAFQELGCTVSIASNPERAKICINKGNADLIVLDWDLGGDVYASDVLRSSLRHIESEPMRLDTDKTPAIVTFSGSPAHAISLPETPYFTYAEHWRKPLRFPDLRKKSLDLLERRDVV